MSNYTIFSALVEIIYPNSWFNITENVNLIEFMNVEKNVKHKIKIPRGRYETVDELNDVLNSSIRFATKREKSSYENFLHFSYMPLKKTISIPLNTYLLQNLMQPQNIIYMLGFWENDFKFINYSNPLTIDLQAYYPADLSCSMSYLYLCCDILEPQIICTKLATLLQVVNVEGKYTSLVSKSYMSPHYIPIV